MEQFCNGEKVIVAGSTWPKDEELLIGYIKQNSQKAKLIIVPHEIDTSHIQSILQNLTVEVLAIHNQKSKSSKRKGFDCRYHWITIVYISVWAYCIHRWRVWCRDT